MDPVSLIKTALTAGATANLPEPSKAAITDAYTSLKFLVNKHFTGTPRAETALTEFEYDPVYWEKPLGYWLVETGAHQDEDILTRSKFLLTLTNPEQASKGKYDVQGDVTQGISFGGAGGVAISGTVGDVAGGNIFVSDKAHGESVQINAEKYDPPPGNPPDIPLPPKSK